MSFLLGLAPDALDVEPGISSPLTIEVTNRSDRTVSFDIEVEGLDSQWVAIPVPTFRVDGNQTHTEKVFFKPPRESESVAGTYPFVVKVRSLETGEVRTAQGMLRINAYHHISMELQPKRGVYSPTTRQNIFTATIMNLGNAPHHLKFFASDPEDACTFHLSEEETSVGPGGQKQIEIEAIPTTKRLFSSSRLFGFTVSGRSTESSVTCSSTAQLEHRPLLTIASLVVIVFLVVLIGGWIALIPKPPVLELLVTDKPRIYKGDPITIRWRAAHAKQVRVSLNGRHVFSSPDLVGAYTLDAVEEGGTLVAIAMRDAKQSPPATSTFEVQERPSAPLPKITQFEISPRSVKVGQSFMVRYKAENAQKLVLMPTGKELIPTESGELQVTVTEPGVVSYQIVAQNGDKTLRSDSIKVTAEEGVDVSVVVFRAEPMVVEAGSGKVKLTYQLANAVRAELKYMGLTSVLEVPEGEVEVDITRPTEFVLIGYDEQGRTVVKKLRVDYKEAAPPPRDPGIGDGQPITNPPTTSSGSTGGDR